MCVYLSLEYTEDFFLGRAIGRVMCLSDVFLPNKENLYFFSLLKNDTRTRTKSNARYCSMYQLCVCVCVCVCACVRACVVRARLCEETARRVVSFVNQTRAFRVSFQSVKNGKSEQKSDTRAR